MKESESRTAAAKPRARLTPAWVLYGLLAVEVGLIMAAQSQRLAQSERAWLGLVSHRPDLPLAIQVRHPLHPGTDGRRGDGLRLVHRGDGQSQAAAGTCGSRAAIRSW